MSATKHIKLFDMNRAAELIEGERQDTLALMEHYIFEAMSSASTWSAGDRLKLWTPTAEMLVPAALKRGTEALHKSTKDQAERERTAQKLDRDELAKFETARMLAWTETLKPDLRLHRDELARWCAGQGFETDEFVVPEVEEPVTGLKTKEMAACLGGLPVLGWRDHEQLRKALSNKRKWVIGALVQGGEHGIDSHIWNPAQVALSLHKDDQVVYSIARLRDQFEQQPTLKKWLAAFESLAESLEFGL